MHQHKQRYFVVGRKNLNNGNSSYAVMDITDSSIVTEWMENSYSLILAKAISLEKEIGGVQKQDFDSIVKFVKLTRFDEHNNEYAVFVLNKSEMRQCLKVIHNNSR